MHPRHCLRRPLSFLPQSEPRRAQRAGSATASRRSRVVEPHLASWLASPVLLSAVGALDPHLRPVFLPRPQREARRFRVRSAASRLASYLNPRPQKILGAAGAGLDPRLTFSLISLLNLDLQRQCERATTFTPSTRPVLISSGRIVSRSSVVPPDAGSHRHTPTADVTGATTSSGANRPQLYAIDAFHEREQMSQRPRHVGRSARCAFTRARAHAGRHGRGRASARSTAGGASSPGCVRAI